MRLGVITCLIGLLLSPGVIPTAARAVEVCSGAIEVPCPRGGGLCPLQRGRFEICASYQVVPGGGLRDLSVDFKRTVVLRAGAVGLPPGDPPRQCSPYFKSWKGKLAYRELFPPFPNVVDAKGLRADDFRQFGNCLTDPRNAPRLRRMLGRRCEQWSPGDLDWFMQNCRTPEFDDWNIMRACQGGQVVVTGFAPDEDPTDTLTNVDISVRAVMATACPPARPLSFGFIGFEKSLP